MTQDQQQPILVEVEGLGTLEFPAGTADSVIDGAVQEAIGETRRERMRQNVLNAPEIQGAAQGMMLPMGGQVTGLSKLVRPVVEGAGEFVTKRAVPMVRSALKQGFDEVRRRAGIEGVMPSQVANRQAQFVIDKQLRSPEQADALVKSLGGKIDDVVGAFERENPDAALDTAERIPKYLNTFLSKRVERQFLPRQDRTAVQNAARELVEDSPLSRSTRTAAAPETLEAGLVRGVNEARAIARNAPVDGVTAQRPRLVNPNLKGLQNQSPRTGIVREVAPKSELDALLKRADGEVAGRAAKTPGTLPRPTNAEQFTGPGGSFSRSSRPRELRTDVKPSEGLELARNKSFFDPNAPQGRVMAGKQIERAVRDSIKELVPDTTPLLRDQGRALDARTALDRAAWRDANRDQVGMGGLLGLANSRPTLGALLQLLKESQLRAGLTAGRIGPQISRSSQRTAEELQLLGNALMGLMRDQSPTGPPE